MIRTERAPVLVGALGGSGTRVVARLLRRAGVFMGSELNEAEDSEPVMRFYNAWLRPYLERGGELTPAEWEAATAQLGLALEEHLDGADRRGSWGVKVPRNILALGFWHRIFPELSFVHVVRSGLDMAYSKDRNQLRMVGDLVLTPSERRRPEPERAIAYWQRVNLEAADFGEARLGPRYLRLRFEDLCAHPARAYAQLRRLAGAGAEPPEDVFGEVTAPGSLGRWRARPRAEVERLMAIAETGSERFGYAEGAMTQRRGAR